MATDTTPARSAETSPPHALAWPEDVAGALGRAEVALRDEGPERALEVLSGAKGASPWLTNARAVCLLRMGETERALHAFRGLAMAASGHGLSDIASTHFKTNYATAQLLADNMTGCIVTLGQTRDEDHPSVRRLREALRSWWRGLSFWEKVRSALGGNVRRPVVLDFPPGEF